jgi:hypothetical protein
MAKPIFIVRAPQGTDYESLSAIRESAVKELDDYHVLIIVDSTKESAEFECYNSTDADEMSFERLQERVMELMSAKETV